MLSSIRAPFRPLERRDLLQFEERHGICLPASYKDFLLKHNGGRPEPDMFPIHGFKNNPEGRAHFFFGIDARHEAYDLNINLNEIKGKVPDGLLPIACTEGVDWICITLPPHGSGQVGSVLGSHNFLGF